jgi:hypothetical protein
VIALVPVGTASRDALRSELAQYLVELARMEGVPLERSADGRPAYSWFDAYWIEDDRRLAGDKARAVGAGHLRASVHSWNEQALRFWTACGFREVDAADDILSTRRVLDLSE